MVMICVKVLRQEHRTTNESTLVRFLTHALGLRDHH